MATINTILEEIKDVPLDRLEELHQYIKSLIPKKRNNEKVGIGEEAEGIELTDWQIKLIEEGEKDVEEGRIISHEDFMKSYGR